MFLQSCSSSAAVSSSSPTPETSPTPAYFGNWWLEHRVDIRNDNSDFSVKINIFVPFFIDESGVQPSAAMLYTNELRQERPDVGRNCYMLVKTHPISFYVTIDLPSK